MIVITIITKFPFYSACMRAEKLPSFILFRIYETGLPIEHESALRVEFYRHST